MIAGVPSPRNTSLVYNPLMTFRKMLPAFALPALALLFACGRPTGVPQPSHDTSQALPFDRESRANGISPSQSLIPPTKRVAEGTPISMRLRTPLSSASAHSGDSFDGSVDEPVVVDGQVLITSGAGVVGRVLDAQHATGTASQGYLRITLVSVNVAGKTILLDTSSIFAKGSRRDGRGGQGSGDGKNRGDIAFTPDRRLTFHLTQAIDLP